MKLNLDEFMFVAQTVMENLDLHACDLSHSDVQIYLYRDNRNCLHLDLKGYK